MRSSKKPTDRARLYLSTVDDWKADYEIAGLLGDTPPPSNVVVRSMMGRLIGRGWVKYGKANDTYRITEEGRSAISKESGHGE